VGREGKGKSIKMSRKIISLFSSLPFPPQSLFFPTNSHQLKTDSLIASQIRKKYNLRPHAAQDFQIEKLFYIQFKSTDSSLFHTQKLTLGDNGSMAFCFYESIRIGRSNRICLLPIPNSIAVKSRFKIQSTIFIFYKNVLKFSTLVFLDKDEITAIRLLTVDGILGLLDFVG
jgi:hypothetical protein